MCVPAQYVPRRSNIWALLTWLRQNDDELQKNTFPSTTGSIQAEVCCCKKCPHNKKGREAGDSRGGGASVCRDLRLRNRLGCYRHGNSALRWEHPWGEGGHEIADREDREAAFDWKPRRWWCHAPCTRNLFHLTAHTHILLTCSCLQRVLVNGEDTIETYPQQVQTSGFEKSRLYTGFEKSRLYTGFEWVKLRVCCHCYRRLLSAMNQPLWLWKYRYQVIIMIRSIKASLRVRKLLQFGS